MEVTATEERKARRPAVGSREQKAYNYIETRQAYQRRQQQEQRELEAKEATEEAFRMEQLDKKFAPADKHDLRNMRR